MILPYKGAFVPTIERHTLKGDARMEAIEALSHMSAAGLKVVLY